MQRLFLLVLTAIFLSGCGSLAKESEFWQHSTMYRNWDHMKFSAVGYKNPTHETAKKSQVQDWWGIPVE